MTPPPLFQTTVKNPSYVYLLRSLKDKKFYLGWTTNLNRRLDAHNKGLNPSTKWRTPFELIGYETFATSDLAKVRERALKRNPNMLQLFKKRVLRTSCKTEKEVVG